MNIPSNSSRHKIQYPFPEFDMNHKYPENNKFNFQNCVNCNSLRIAKNLTTNQVVVIIMTSIKKARDVTFSQVKCFFFLIDM